MFSRTGTIFDARNNLIHNVDDKNLTRFAYIAPIVRNTFIALIMHISEIECNNVLYMSL